MRQADLFDQDPLRETLEALGWTYHEVWPMRPFYHDPQGQRYEVDEARAWLAEHERQEAQDGQQERRT